MKPSEVILPERYLDLDNPIWYCPIHGFTLPIHCRLMDCSTWRDRAIAIAIAEQEEVEG